MKTERQKISYRLRLIGTIFMLGGLISFLNYPNSVKASTISEENILELVNIERKDYGLKPLRINSDLDRAAELKSKDMISRNYFEHYFHGLTPWDFMLLADYNYLSGGENLAMDFQTSEGVVNAWMNSPAHRDNILNPDFEDTGLGIVKGIYTTKNGVHETVMITNMFGRRKSLIYRSLESLKNYFSF